MDEKSQEALVISVLIRVYGGQLDMIADENRIRNFWTLIS